MASTSNHQITSKDWNKIVMELYPEALTCTYSVPPIYFRRVPYAREAVPGTGLTALVPNPPVPCSPTLPVLSSLQALPQLIGPQSPPPPQTLWPTECHRHPHDKPGRVQDTDLQDDAAQAHVLHNLQALGQRGQEAMFILSQVNFNNYLNKPAFAAAVAQLPNPSQLNTPVQSFTDGDFDILIIHRHRGVLVGELKTVGRNQVLLNMPQADIDKEVVKKLVKAVKQLDKSETVIRHLVKDIAPGLTIRKTLFLPYISSAHLGQILANNPQIEQVLMTSLGVSTASDAVNMCCTSDRLSSPESSWDISPTVMQELDRWWALTMNTTNPSMNYSLYLDIVARFVGPATTVHVHCSSTPRVRMEVRTEGQAVAQLGLMLASLVLTRPQIDLLTWSPQQVFISGPPGTGKTVVLVVQALKWLRQQNDVHVVSTSIGKTAVTTMICHQLETTLGSDPTPLLSPGHVVMHLVDLRKAGPDADIVGQAVRDLAATTHVIMDEVNFDTSSEYGRRCLQLVTDLGAQIPGLHLWCAGVTKFKPPPAMMSVFLTQPLRCAPVVLREVQRGVNKIQDVLQYTGSSIPAPSDGLRVTHLVHQGGTHTGRWPVHCIECGKNIASELRRLGVGTEGSGISYRDVLVVTRSTELQDEVTDHVGNITSPASGVVQGLRGAGLRVCVLGDRHDRQRDRAKWERNMKDVAVARSDAVTAASCDVVNGLERRIVVFLPGRGLDDEGRSDEAIEAADRLLVMSRCTTQLIIINVPAPVS